MSLGGCPDTLVVLLVLTVEGIIHQIAITQDLGAMNFFMVDLDRSLLIFLFDGRHFGAMSREKESPEKKAGGIYKRREIDTDGTFIFDFNFRIRVTVPLLVRVIRGLI